MSGKTLLILAFLALMDETVTIGIGKAWDVSATHKLPYPLRFLSWTRTDGSPFDVKTISGIGQLSTLNPGSVKKSNPKKLQNEPVAQHRKQKRAVENTEEERIEHANPEITLHELMAKLDSLDGFGKIVHQFPNIEEDLRHRRDADKQMEKISGVTNIERQTSNGPDSEPESWSKQPISVEFRHRTDLEQIARVNEDRDNEEHSPNISRDHQIPRIDFITSNRRQFSDSRESRDLPMSRQAYDDYDMHPILRSYHGRSRDYQIPIVRTTYPNRYRTERDYYYRVPMDMRMKPLSMPLPSPPFYNRYRQDVMDNEDQYVDSYGRHRSTIPTKPRRIIYYATLPEVVRKPVDIRNYPRYSGSLPPPSRSPNGSSLDRSGVRGRPTGNNVDTTAFRKPYNKFAYPPIFNKYPNIDSWAKRSSHYEQIPQSSYSGNQDRIADSKDSYQVSDSLADDGKQVTLSRMRSEDQEMPWPVQVAAEVSVKENDRVTGRKIFGHVEGYGDRKRYQDKRTKDKDSDQELSGN